MSDFVERITDESDDLLAYTGACNSEDSCPSWLSTKADFGCVLFEAKS